MTYPYATGTAPDRHHEHDQHEDRADGDILDDDPRDDAPGDPELSDEDAEIRDADLGDEGAPPVDATLTDATLTDATLTDATPTDATPTDAAPADAAAEGTILPPADSPLSVDGAYTGPADPAVDPTGETGEADAEEADAELAYDADANEADEPDESTTPTAEMEAVDAGEDEESLVGDTHPHPLPGPDADAVAQADGNALTEDDEDALADGDEDALADGDEDALADGGPAAVILGDDDVVGGADEGTTLVDADELEVATDQPAADAEVLDTAAVADPDDAVAVGLVDGGNCAEPDADVHVVNGEHIVDGRIVAPVIPSGTMFPGDATVNGAAPASVDRADLRQRLQQAQLSFIDDPHGAADAARALAAEAVRAHIDALQTRQGELDSWQSESAPDTEVLRAAMRGYRDLVTTLVEQ